MHGKAPIGTQPAWSKRAAPGWTDPYGTQVWLEASQVDRALSWTRAHPQLNTASDAAGTAESPDRPAERTRAARRGEHRTAADVAAEATAPDAGKAVRQSFRRLAKVPVVIRDTQELLDVLTIRLRQWGHDTPPPQRRSR